MPKYPSRSPGNIVAGVFGKHLSHALLLRHGGVQGHAGCAEAALLVNSRWDAVLRMLFQHFDCAAAPACSNKAVQSV